MKKCILLVFLAYFITHESIAQNSANSADSLITKLDSVIVLGRVLSSSNNISNHLLSGTSPQIIDALNSLSGVTKIHDTGYPLVYRGMHGNRLRIERNGVLKTGVLTQGYLTDDLNPGNIESIDVTKGIDKVLFGSGASGGVIQIHETDARKKISNRFYTGYSSNNIGRILGTTLNTIGSHSGIRFSGRRSVVKDFKDATRQHVLNSANSQNNLNLSSFIKGSGGLTELVWNHNYNNGFLERPQGFQNNPFELRTLRNSYTYQTNLLMESRPFSGLWIEQRLWGLFVRTDQIKENFNADFSAINNWENRAHRKQAFGYRGNLKTNLNNSISMNVGLDFIASWLEINTSFRDFIDQSLSRESTDMRTEKLLGIFSKLSLEKRRHTLGVAIRADWGTVENQQNKVNPTALTAGIEFEWLTSEKLKNSFSISRLFRYPSQMESVGITFGGRGVFIGNPDIKPEFSHQLEWRLMGYNGKWEYGIDSWVAVFGNRITEVLIGPGQFTYQNTEKARTIGIEGRVTRVWLKTPTGQELKTSLISSLIRGDELTTNNLLARGTPLIGIPSSTIALWLEYKSEFSKSTSLRVSTNVERVGALSRIPEGQVRQLWGVQKTEAYWLLNSRLQLEISFNNFGLKLGVSGSNLSNSDYFPFGARIKAMGRNFNTFLSFSF